MMQAQALDAFFLGTQDPFPSPLSVTYCVNPIADSFSYNLEPGQTINGIAVSDSGTGSGNFTSGLYEWSSSLAVGSDTAASTYTASWDPDTVNVNGTIATGPGVRWLVSGTTTLNPLNSDYDSGTVTLQAQVYNTIDDQTQPQWNNSDPPINATLASDCVGTFDWQITVSYKNKGYAATSKGSWATLPEPPCFDLFWTGSTWAAVAGAAFILRTRRSGKRA
jgi:hypothetical protein